MRKIDASRVFRERVREFVTSRGATKSFGAYRYILDTPVGELGISIWENSIVCRFQYPTRAAEFAESVGEGYRLNPLSGKFNFHYDPSPETLLNNCGGDFTNIVDSLLGFEPTERFCYERQRRV